MRHQKKKFSNNRQRSQSQNIYRNMAKDLIIHGQIKTTLIKAKRLKTFFEPILTKAKNNNLVTRRYLISKLHNPRVVKLLLEKVAPEIKSRKSGYLRLTRLGYRLGDGSAKAKIEIIK